MTNNRASMPRHLKDHLAAGRHVPGILIIGGNMTVGEVVEELILIHGAARPEQLADQVNFLPVAW